MVTNLATQVILVGKMPEKKKVKLINQVFSASPETNMAMHKNLDLVSIYNAPDLNEKYLTAKCAAQVLCISEEELMQWNFGLRVLMLGARCFGGQEMYSLKVLSALDLLHNMPE